MPTDSTAAFYEFFAGGGMARAGLGPAWRCLLANDIDPAKGATYAAAFGDEVLRVGDIWSLDPTQAPGQADLAWASFPCQDLSLAGARGGLHAPRSGAFWGLYKLVSELGRAGRAPHLLCLENVTGLLTSQGGADFAALCEALVDLGYRIGGVTGDAAHFTPQSRPRVFVIATRAPPPRALTQSEPESPFHPPRLIQTVASLAPTIQKRWVWWRLPAPAARNLSLADILEPDASVIWRTPAQTARLLSLMSGPQRARIAALQETGGRAVGAVFRRMRMENGRKAQRAEARFDGLAGCLRTPAGGSSRQTVLVIEGGVVRSRLLTPRECARLMGLPEEYPLPAAATAALHLLGDGVAPPVVRWLSEHLLLPLAQAARASKKSAA